MDIEEAIKHCEDVANGGCGECSKEHHQLAIWLRELVELKEKKNDCNEIVREDGEGD